MNLIQKLDTKLQQRLAEGNLRTLRTPTLLYDFCSNDYLGLSRNAELQDKINESLHQFPTQNGATGSRLISGNSLFYGVLENQLKQIFRSESALVFNSGYQANSALLSTITDRHDTILLDELSHASLREGARLSLAKSFYFRHNDLEDLERKLQENAKTQGNILVVIESVYSMDGDFGEIREIAKLCKQYEAYLIVDEAHSTGIFGEKGEGLVCELGLEKEVFACVYTFGKALGAHGACVTGSKILTDYLTNFARSFIYTTAMPLHSLVSISEGFSYIEANPQRRNDLFEKINFFKNGLKNILKPSETPIQILPVGGNLRTKSLAENLQKAGFDCRAILSPTVKEGQEIIRICLHTHNSEAEIADLVKNIQEIHEV